MQIEDNALSFLLAAILVFCVTLSRPGPLQSTGPRAPGAGKLAAPSRTQPHFIRLFDGKTLDGWIQVPANSWTVKERAMASTGAGRGFIYTEREYSNYRLVFTSRHVSGVPGHDHQMCFLIFCTRPAAGQKPLDALGGIQLQPPNGGHWDYRPGHNNVGEGEFTRLHHREFDPHQWFRVEVLVDAAHGTARMAVAQPVGSKAVEVLDFNLPSAGKKGPIAFQMHNQGLIDEYKDVMIEINPPDYHLITVE